MGDESEAKEKERAKRGRRNEREREGFSKSSLRQMVRSFARGGTRFCNKRGAAIDVWRMRRRRFLKITASSQKLHQLRRKRRKGSLRSKRSFHAGSTRKLGPEREKGEGGKEKLAKQTRETDAGKRQSSYNRKKAEIGSNRTQGMRKG